MIILQVENAEKKWNYENTFVLAKLKIPPRTETRDLILYLDDKGENNKFGNWKAAGHHRYHQIRAQIKKDRANEKTPGYENECRLRLYKLHDMDKKLGKKKAKKGKAPRINLSNATVGDASDDDAYEIEGYETDDEARELLAKAQVVSRSYNW